MIRLALLLFAFALPAYAQKIDLNFDKIGLVQFGEATFKAILKEDFIIDPLLIDDQRRLTLQVKSLDKSAVRETLHSVLAQSGIKVERREGVNWMIPALPAQQQGANPAPASLPDIQLYQPRFRPVDQLQRIVNAALSTSLSDPEFVLIAAPTGKRKAIASLLEQYDTKPFEIVARAAVIEYTEESDKGFSFKTAFSAFGDKLNLSFGGSTLANFVTFKNGTIEAVLSAIEGDSRFNLVTQPTLRIRHGATGRFTVGADVPVLDSIQVDKQGNPIQSVTYRQSGVIFALLPRIMADRIELDVTQQLSSFQRNQTSGIDSPTLLKRELSTSVGVESGDMVILAGLDESKENSSTSGFSFLPDFMRSSKRTSGKTQLLLFIEVRRV